MWQNRLVCKLTPFSSRAANGLLMLLTNLLTCSKCLVISVARTMSIIACRSVRYSFLEREREETEAESQHGQNTAGRKRGKWNETTVRWRAWRGVWTVSPFWLQWQRWWMDVLFTVPIWGDRHMWAVSLGDSNHIIPYTSIDCTLMPVYLQFPHHLNRKT